MEDKNNPKPPSRSAKLHYPAWTNSPNHHTRPRPTTHRKAYSPTNNEHVLMHTLPAYSNWYMDTGATFHTTSHYQGPRPRLLGPRPVQSPWQSTHHHETYSPMHALGRNPADSNWGYMDTGATTSHGGPRPRLLGPTLVQFPWQPTLHHEPYSATNNEQVMHTFGGYYPADPNWYMDTGAIFHTTSNRDLMMDEDRRRYDQEVSIRPLGPTMDFSSKVAVKLLLKGVEEGKKNNMLTSPLSYNAIMNMIAAGSSNNTLVQIFQFLERKNIEEVNSEFSMFEEITHEHTKRKGMKCKTQNKGITWETRSHENKGDAPIISFLNGAWLNEKHHLKDSFAELIENLYKARIRNIDCTKMVVQETNEWANASTKGLIKEVFEEHHIKRDTVLILGNALYFKGSWKKPFIKNRSRDGYFYLLDSKIIKVPFMTGCQEFFHKFFQDCKVARIPYNIGKDVNREFAMYIFLPYEKDGLQKLLKKVNSNSNFFNQHCDLPRTSTDYIVNTFLIPKFKFSYLTEDGKDIMEDMGLTLPFDRKKAEFYEMIDLFNERVCVTDIIQNAFIEVNEEGTEAAAVTYALFVGYGCGHRT